MAAQKEYLVKIYGQDGSTFVRTLATSRQESLDGALYLLNTPAFKSQLNGIYGECVLDLGARFDDFDEGTRVDFMNVVKIYAVKHDDSTSPPTQSTSLIYTGYMSRYEPFLEDGNEGVRVTLLSLGSILSYSYYKNGTNFTVSHSAQDPETVMRAIIDHVNTIYGGSLFSYSNDTTDPVGTNITYDFVDQLWFDALKKTGELAGTDWWWKIDETGKLWLKAKPSSPTHTFTIGKDIVSIRPVKDSEGVVNDVQVRRTGGTATDYSDATSQGTYGTGSTPSGKRTRIITDSNIQNSTTADQRGNKEVNDNKDAKISVVLVINQNYDLESIKVGETCKFANFKGSNTFFGASQNLMIASVDYQGETVTVELERQTTGFGLQLANFVNRS